MENPNKETIKKAFWLPLEQAFAESQLIRKCNEYSDYEHLFCGISRVIEIAMSGRAWIQNFQFIHESALSVGSFFMTLKSRRRTAMLAEVAQKISLTLDEKTLTTQDPLLCHEELNGFSIYATDGHTHKASAHEDPILGKVRAPTHIFSLNLRTHSLSHIDLCVPEKGKKKEHEITTLKRIEMDALRLGNIKGQKVIHVYDPAIIDYEQWKSWKNNKGIYVITLEKSNSILSVETEREIDEDNRNAGVLKDEEVISVTGVRLRRIVYEDPVTGKIYRFLTNEMTLLPGLIAFLYKLRWDIEKVFDELKNKFDERKAWGKTEDAKKQQALFMTIAHNLTLMLERKLENEEGIIDEKVRCKKRKRKMEEVKKAKASGRKISPLVVGMERATQRSLQFIRWLRSTLLHQTPWPRAIEKLRPLMLKYIS